ncbi:hypothetical protein DFJ74DRAFT_218011 [Hyaloraphidium curvatum]|nr:hypothetical protein DFJ74DRAFT_218011 [Hyaloraphidium curvatum]
MTKPAGRPIAVQRMGLAPVVETYHTWYTELGRPADLKDPECPVWEYAARGIPVFYMAHRFYDVDESLSLFLNRDCNKKYETKPHARVVFYPKEHAAFLAPNVVERATKKKDKVSFWVPTITAKHYIDADYTLLYNSMVIKSLDDEEVLAFFDKHCTKTFPAGQRRVNYRPKDVSAAAPRHHPLLSVASSSSSPLPLHHCLVLKPTAPTPRSGSTVQFSVLGKTDAFFHPPSPAYQWPQPSPD